MAEKTLLAETAHVLAIAQAGQGDTLFICFNVGEDYAGGLDFPGSRFLAAQSWPAVGIVDRKKNWFPKASMPQIIAAVRAHIAAGGYRRVVAYGFSMGAYAALRFAADLGVDLAIAFSPQTSIDPSHTGFSNSFWNEIDPTLRGGMLVEPQHVAPRNLVLYDPHFAYDRWYARRLESFPNTSTMIFPLVGHVTFPVLAESRLTRAFFEAALAEDYPAARRVLRDARSKSASCLTGRSEILERRGQLKGAVGAALAAVQASPYNMRVAAFYGTLAARAGLGAEAAETLLASPLVAKGRGRLQRGLLQRLVRQSSQTVALALVEKAEAAGRPLAVSPVTLCAIRLWGGDRKTIPARIEALAGETKIEALEWEFLAETLLKLGLPEQAVVIQRRGLEDMPDSLATRAKLARLLNQAGEKALAKREAEAADEMASGSLADLRLLMRLHRELGALHRVDKIAHAILAQKPGLFEIRRELVESHLRRKELAPARRHLAKAMSFKTLTPGDYVAISRYYGDIQRTYDRMQPTQRDALTPETPDIALALPPAEKAVALEPESLGTRLTLIEAELRLDLKARAAANLEVVLTQMEPTDATHWLRIAEMLHETGQTAKAREVIRRAAKGHNWNPAARIGAARFLAEQEAKADAEAILAPIDIAALDSVNTLHNLHDVFILVGRDDRALAAARRSLQLDRYDEVMIKQATLLGILGRHGNAPAAAAPVPPPKRSGLFAGLRARFA